MKPYSKQDIIDIYNNLIQSAHKNYLKNRLREALNDIVSAANWAYNFNHIYTDISAELLLKQISEKIVKPDTVSSPRSNRCVLIDSFLLDNRGLSQQYLRAMMANDMDILVIYTTPGGKIGKDTLAEITSYNKSKVVSFLKGVDTFEETLKIVHEIREFSPAHIFLHLTPWDVVALMACHAIKGSKTYQINLTDHAFWLGSKFIDYNIEFRPCGMTISLEQRHLNKGQLVQLPFYPITPICDEFQGLPNVPKNAIKIFTGGAVYKMLGADNLFFKIMDKILDINPQVFILVAGFEHDSRFEYLHKQMINADRVKVIGVRMDINAVFDNIDIYLNTFPLGGGLMVQYAAEKGKPILAYREQYNVITAIEETVNPDGNPDVVTKSFTDLDAMIDYAQRLILDRNYLETEGKRIKEGLMTSDQFNDLFGELIKGKVLVRGWKKVPNVNYESFFNSYLERENTYGFKATYSLVSKQKFHSLKIIKHCKMNMLIALCEIVGNTSLYYLHRWFLSRRIPH